jgi:DNA-binding beta-propeller fold protein YncE
MRDENRNNGMRIRQCYNNREGIEMILTDNRLLQGSFMFRRAPAGWFASLMLLAATILPQLAEAARDYEIWAIDQGTHIVHIYDSGLNEIDRIDLGSHGAQVPHMIDFTSDHAYAFIANLGSGDVAVVRTADREVIDIVKTGPRTHMAGVKPDDSAVIADVIGAADQARDGRLVEIVIDLETETFAIGRTLIVAEDPAVQEVADRFPETAPICHEYTPDSRHAFVTLGPGLHHGGLVIVDTGNFTVTKAFPPDVLRVNCGTALTPDGRHMLVNGGDKEVGVWYAIDTATLEVVRESSSRGHDAHGVWTTPDGREIWMINRVSDDGIIIDPVTLDIIGEIADIGETPDIIAMSPDSRYAYFSLRGPNPKSAPHVAVGTTPGFSVVDIAERRLVRLVEPAKGNPDSDFHGIGVRVLH